MAALGYLVLQMNYNMDIAGMFAALVVHDLCEACARTTPSRDKSGLQTMWRHPVLSAADPGASVYSLRIRLMAALASRKGSCSPSIVCTENSIRVDNATESPNLSGDDRPVLPLLVPLRLAVQVEEST